MKIKEYYRILDLPENADLELLNEHFRKKIKQFHPDRFAGNLAKQKTATEVSKQINQAYSELKKHISSKKKMQAAGRNKPETAGKADINADESKPETENLHISYVNIFRQMAGSVSGFISGIGSELIRAVKNENRKREMGETGTAGTETSEITRKCRHSGKGSFREILAMSSSAQSGLSDSRGSSGAPDPVMRQRTRRAQAYAELVEMRSRYGSGKKETEYEPGAVSPVSAIAGIKTRKHP